MDGLPKLRILAVDDSRANLQVLRKFLESSGHQVIPAESGEEAVALYGAQPPDLILMDIVMARMDGLEATRRIRALPSPVWVPIIFLSALNRDENLIGGLEAGGDDYLSKPINFVLLEAKIRSMQRTLVLQQRVADSLHRLRTISDNVLEAIITIDTEATITSCNKLVEELFGWSVEELVGQNVRVLCPEPYRSAHDGYVRDYVSGGPPKIIGSGREVLAQHRDGTIFAAELAVSEVRLEGRRMFIGVIRDISERKRAETLLRDNAEKLQRYYETTEAENRLASELIERQMMREELNDPLVSYWVSPALNFSGDVLAAARSPEGKLYAMIADATGHGLTAAISTLPVLTLFYRLARNGAELRTLVEEINQFLHESMPVGRFVAATLIAIDPAGCEGEIWVAGMPAAYLLDAEGNSLREFGSGELPLGIVDNGAIDFRPLRFNWPRDGNCQLVLCSDGLIEAESADGVAFGRERLLSTLRGKSARDRRDALQDALLTHLDTTPPQDDVSLLLVSCA
ncbi:MAG TPA: SpoIIE family protein phosphatase [Azospira sp.]|nr:SpoIIE family protein phosphatase [Azospira sp.]